MNTYTATIAGDADGAPVRTYQAPNAAQAGKYYAAGSGVRGTLASAVLPDGRTLVVVRPTMGAPMRIVVTPADSARVAL